MLRSICSTIILSLLASGIFAQQANEQKVVHDLSLELEGEYRFFFQDASFEGQKRHFPALAIKPEYSVAWNKGYDRVAFTGFFRLDIDSRRTHWDIRELYYQRARNNWELSVGLKKIFWGVTESNHLVDIINQTDQVESFDGEEKLGQPMVQFSLTTNKLGTFDLFYLPHHRERQFAGEKGRLRLPVLISRDDVGYESGMNMWRPGFAARWSHFFGIFDAGLSYFHGNGREPVFTFDGTGNINAFYPVINQVGADLQVTHAAFLWKFESVYRHADIQDFFAFAAGLEYTFSNVNGKGLDIGLLGEYSYDGRGVLALSSLQNDLFFGSRIAFNDKQDTSVLFGGIFDLGSSGKILSLEASRRIGDNWTASLETRIFLNISNDELILSNFGKDSFMKVSFSRFF